MSRILSTEGEGDVCLIACWDTPPSGQTPPLGTPPSPGYYGIRCQQAAVGILLECILVWQDFFRKQHEIGPRDGGGGVLGCANVWWREVTFACRKTTVCLTNAKRINMKNLTIFARLHFLYNSLQFWRSVHKQRNSAHHHRTEPILFCTKRIEFRCKWVYNSFSPIKGPQLSLSVNIPQARIQDLAGEGVPASEAKFFMLIWQSRVVWAEWNICGQGSFWVLSAQVYIFPHSRDSFSLIFVLAQHQKLIK